jgi:aminoglycoside 2'-N-acetyltransferase I
MSIEIDILNGDASWPMAKPLFDAVWPPEVVAKLPWAGIMFAHAELRVLVQAEYEDVVCHVGIYRREVTWNGRKFRAGGIGGVLTREDSRGKGYATIALNAAMQTLKDEGATDFGLLFCEPHNGARSLRSHGALCLPSQARAADRNHRSRRPPLVIPPQGNE